MEINSSPANRTLRLWEYISGGYVKLSIRPGQCLKWHRRWAGDEGASWEYASYSHDGDCVRLESGSGGRDCDGNHAHHANYVCPPDKLAARQAYSDPSLLLAEWQSESEWQRDQYAELAGY